LRSLVTAADTSLFFQLGALVAAVSGPARHGAGRSGPDSRCGTRLLEDMVSDEVPGAGDDRSAQPAGLLAAGSRVAGYQL